MVSALARKPAFWTLFGSRLTISRIGQRRLQLGDRFGMVACRLSLLSGSEIGHGLVLRFSLFGGQLRRGGLATRSGLTCGRSRRISGRSGLTRGRSRRISGRSGRAGRR
ncbi:MAG: hypothetical protein MEP44_09460 [Blastomonas sp.]|nr:hypothetical protein [Blastomonas sp.]